MKYVYPAIFTKEIDGGFSVKFPDLSGAVTSGKNLSEAIFMAEDCLGLVLFGMEEEKLLFPKPSAVTDFQNEETQFMSLVNVDLNEYKKRTDNKPIKKTLYIPKELNDKAENLGVNFSEILRQALRKHVTN